ncbi:hypothetical protein NEF87_003560 [Candidatus Lokiarchaeum ossiferum]|uniref:Uncharacterized protein n=1 Tax=Candidatus Lokiarchaeum ossiferum TaxID=2951803 RepID=A0ABY6HUT3_9ARCH|nr:hypothetical protein NEF87_003560 [Candidatus Lokiarchaeum sp. B-35]
MENTNITQLGRTSAYWATLLMKQNLHLSSKIHPQQKHILKTNIFFVAGSPNPMELKNSSNMMGIKLWETQKTELNLLEKNIGENYIE